MKRLENKVAVITGGNSGIGLSTAKEFAAQGATVVITGRNKQSLDAAVKEIGGNTKAIVSDAGKLSDNKALPAQLQSLGISKIDVLFYNAGVAQFAPVAETSEDVFNANMDINFRGAFFTAQALLPLINEGGSIIFNTTVLANRTMAGNGAYGASKAALTSLAKTMAVELAARKIRVNSLSPGAISTPIYSKLGMNEQELNAFAAGFIPKIPQSRFGDAAEIAKAALFLASADSSYVTGAELVVDGGTGVLW
jgi:NAD(P)-dependent dehydrogenase (short-subunit alcohol dehydrogenase family)